LGEEPVQFVLNENGENETDAAFAGADKIAKTPAVAKLTQGKIR